MEDSFGQHPHLLIVYIFSEAHSGVTDSPLYPFGCATRFRAGGERIQFTLLYIRCSISGIIRPLLLWGFFSGGNPALTLWFQLVSSYGHPCIKRDTPLNPQRIHVSTKQLLQDDKSKYVGKCLNRGPSGDEMRKLEPVGLRWQNVEVDVIGTDNLDSS